MSQDKAYRRDMRRMLKDLGCDNIRMDNANNGHYKLTFTYMGVSCCVSCSGSPRDHANAIAATRRTVRRLTAPIREG